MIKPIEIKVTIEPIENDIPWNKTSLLLFAISIKLKILREITGNTQGIKFNNKPPIKAENNAINRFKELNLFSDDTLLDEK